MQDRNQAMLLHNKNESKSDGRDTQQRDSWREWLGLRLVRGVGNVTYRVLLEHFGSPQAVFAASVTSLTATGVSAEVGRAITSFDQWDTVETELHHIAQARVRLVTRLDPEYPDNLTHVHDPPPFLYVRGRFQAEDHVAIALVGSRAASAYGRGVAKDLARGLALKGVTVVSGLARGIDAEAHRAALDAGGRTLAVLGSGLDVIYPREHHALAQEMSHNGAVISEFSLGSQPEAGHFPYRNRVISGLTLGTVVIEAAERSGSLITARCALEQNREVFAVPGNITAGRSRGPHQLIKQGAKLVENVDDILSEIAPGLASGLAPVLPSASQTAQNEPAIDLGDLADLAPDEALLVKMFDGEPLHVDVLIARTGLGPARVLEVLLGLELKGIVTQLPGTHFAKTGKVG